MIVQMSNYILFYVILYPLRMLVPSQQCVGMAFWSASTRQLNSACRRSSDVYYYVIMYSGFDTKFWKIYSIPTTGHEIK